MSVCLHVQRIYKYANFVQFGAFLHKKLAKMSRISVPAEDVLAELLASDDESLQGDNYRNFSDFESEYSGSETEEQTDVCQVSQNNSDQYDVDMPNPQNTLEDTTAPISPPSVSTNNTRGRGRRSSQKGNNFQYDWSRDTSSFIEQTFSPKQPTAPKNIPNSINAEITIRLFFLVLG